MREPVTHTEAVQFTLRHMNSRALALPSTAPAKLSITLLSGREGNLSDPTPEVLELLEDLRQGAKSQSPLDLSQLRLAGLDLSALDLSDCCLGESEPRELVSE